MSTDSKTVRTRNKILVIGASGAIGTRLVRRLVELRGAGSVVAALHRSPLPADLRSSVIQEFGVDITELKTLDRVFRVHGSTIDKVWNLAAPLSVETARNPDHAYNVTVRGMERVLQCMRRYGVRHICFSDSIGSYGAAAPRRHATARWLVANPNQDPGSDYGRQKRECRRLMKAFAAEQADRSSRWAVIPGVLHDDGSWGAGTTEYALDAIKHAVLGRHYACPVPLNESLPMIFASDLVNGLIALMDAVRSSEVESKCEKKSQKQSQTTGILREPEGGYALAGFSFTPTELFSDLKHRFPQFQFSVALDNGATVFSRLWPDSLSPEQAAVDLGFRATIGFTETVDRIVRAHVLRQQARAKR